MKFLVLTLLLITTKTYAAGCGNTYHDVSMTEEIVVTGLGDSEATLECSAGKCTIFTSKEISVGSEQHNLISMDVIQKKTALTSIGKLEVKIYRQTFQSMCSQVIRYVLGLDYEGQRYREQDDIQYID